MRLVDIKPGHYVGVHYTSRDDLSIVRRMNADYAQPTASEFDRIASRAIRLEVAEVGVPVPMYARHGVRARLVDSDTGEPLPPRDGFDPSEWTAMRAVNVLAPWDEFVNAHQARLEADEAEAIAKAEHRAQAQARAQEKAARDWMTREFIAASRDIEQVLTVRGFAEPSQEFDGDDVRALVELRNPDGNPYLPGPDGQPPRQRAHA